FSFINMNIIIIIILCHLFHSTQMGKVVEQSISEFLETKFSAYKIKKISDKERENFKFNNSRIYGNVEIATFKENDHTVVIKPINTANIHVEVNEVKKNYDFFFLKIFC